MYFKNKIKFTLPHICFAILFFSFYSLLLLNQTNVFGQNDMQNLIHPLNDSNIVVAGDWYCNEETQKTINNILSVDPELIITTGDHVKDVNSADCWIKMSKPIKDKMNIAIGNHDVEFANIYKQLVDYHHIRSPYYSHDFQNIHFISMSTEHPFEIGSNQYEFIKNDLEKTSTNSTIDWIIVHQHKPLYSTKQDHTEAKQLRDTYEQLFQKYDVDLVISSHNQYYERTYPILYNENDELKNDESDPPKPIITLKKQFEYPPTDGIIFLTVGTAGDKLDPVKENPYFYVVQQSKFGFLNINIQNNGKTLFGEFVANDGSLIDQFVLHTLPGKSYQGDKIVPISPDTISYPSGVELTQAGRQLLQGNDDLSICDKLLSLSKELIDGWQQGQITDEQFVLLSEQAKKLIESSCVN
jgi:hypothetical protein